VRQGTARPPLASSFIDASSSFAASRDAIATSAPASIAISAVA
jgi:hypothetical protein